MKLKSLEISSRVRTSEFVRSYCLMWLVYEFISIKNIFLLKILPQCMDYNHIPLNVNIGKISSSII